MKLKPFDTFRVAFIGSSEGKIIDTAINVDDYDVIILLECFNYDVDFFRTKVTLIHEAGFGCPVNLILGTFFTVTATCRNSQSISYSTENAIKIATFSYKNWIN